MSSRTIDELARQADEHPEDGAAAFRYAEALDAAGREAEAVPVYRRALHAGLPDELEYRAMVQLGSSLRVTAQADDAVAVHRRVQARWPGRMANPLFLALALHDAGRPAEALGEALAGCLLAEGNRDIDYYRRALGEYAQELRRRRVTDRGTVSRWLAAYEAAWRAPGTEGLAAIFSRDAVYLHSPYEEPVAGLDAIARLWERDREGPGEVFTLVTDILAVDGPVAVVRAEVRYGDPVRQEYRNLWVLRLTGDGHCTRFEEWPYWPGHPYAAPGGPP